MHRVERYLTREIKHKKAIHLTLIDPDKCNVDEASKIAEAADKSGSSGIMVGGSIGVSERELDEIIRGVKKKCRLPVILFPGNVSGISRLADAIWFMTLLNSTNPYYITGAQALGAPIVKKYKLEGIPMGYIIVGEGGAAGFFGQARAIPLDKPKIAAAYALAAQYMGMRFVYLEQGSGAEKPIPVEFIKVVRETIKIPLIVGGGIRTGDHAKSVVSAGANIVVTGTVIEKCDDVEKVLRDIITGILKGAEEAS